MRLYGLTTITPAADLPVSLDQLKTQCRVDVDDTFHDSDLAGLLAAATSLVESMADLSICDQTVRLTLPRFPRGRSLWLPRGPVREVVSVAYIDPDGEDQTLEDDAWTLSAGDRPQRIVLGFGWQWPGTAIGHPNAVRVTYQTGAETREAVDPIARQLVLFLAAYWFRHREAVTTDASAVQLPFAAQALLDQLRGAEEFLPYGIEP